MLASSNQSTIRSSFSNGNDYEKTPFTCRNAYELCIGDGNNRLCPD